MKAQKISPQAILALKEALASIYWRKKELRQFIELTMENPLIVSTIDWQENPKFESVSQLIDRMVSKPDMYQDDLLRLLREVSSFNDFSHLKYWDDKGDLTKRAQETVKRLRAQTQGYFDAIDEQRKSEERRQANIAQVKESIDFSSRLDALKQEFFTLALSANPQERGVLFEKLLNALFDLFDLDPKSAFRIVGEQIDGAFTFDNQDYLLEAKWQKDPINAADLYAFGGKIAGKLKNTLGLYVSLDGFSKECTETGSPITKSMMLVDGQDLMQILDGRIRLDEAIFIKRRHAAETGQIYLKLASLQ